MLKKVSRSSRTIQLCNQISFRLFFGLFFPCRKLYRFEKYNEAIDDIIKALDIDYDNKAFHLMQEVADSTMTPLVAKLKIQATKIQTIVIGLIA